MKIETLWYAMATLFLTGYIGVIVCYLTHRIKESKVLSPHFYYFMAIMIGGALGSMMVFCLMLMQYLNYYGR